MSDTPGSSACPLRIAVVGSGPSGFYAAESLLSAGAVVHVDMFERLPVPFGLVRYGVAPDHAKIKNVIKVYEKTAGNERFSFFGNVTVGADISVEELQTWYDAVIFTTGASSDRELGIPGETLAGSYTATEFVGWYNGHPDFVNRTFDLSQEVAAVIGQGNVAVDVCRILCKTVDELKNTDIARHALEALAESKVREVHMIGRRGPAQAAFTPVEIREFLELSACSPVVDPADLELSPASRQELDGADAARRRKNFEILQQMAAATAGKPKRFVLDFYRGPKEYQGKGRIEKIVLEKNTLTGEPGRQKASGTGELVEFPCGLVFRSVGYKGVAVPGLPFDAARGIIPNTLGRIEDNGQRLAGLYCAGWIKRGPSGVIGTNKPDSVETVEQVLSDAPALTKAPQRDSAALKAMLRNKGVRVVDFADWKRIDTAEIDAGAKSGKPREKFVSADAMLDVLDRQKAKG